MFIKELQVRLAQQLLAIRDYSLQREVSPFPSLFLLLLFLLGSGCDDGMTILTNERQIKNVEILKFRFGEVSLQGCEVMIKDLQDSKRIDQVIHERSKVSPSFCLLFVHFVDSARFGRESRC